ncbi:MAG: DUF4124 domain-containing protein [Lacisediminimonas sp.]|nr:DUF4124 domain-containing protein [Lacisediminimonas sp.]
MFLQAALAIGVTAFACLCTKASAQDIYTCVDARGRTITADRQIAECMDRTQNELTRSGTIRRQVGPSLTAKERAAQDAKDKLAADVRAREADEKRRDRALLLRYPGPAVHQKERAAALAQIDVVIHAASKRTDELTERRKAILNEFEFYAQDPGKAPAALKRQRDENDSSLAAQGKFMGERQQEKNRVNQRFDQELVKLQRLWAPTTAATARDLSRYQNTSKTTP